MKETNIFQRFLKGEPVTQVGVNVSVTIDNVTLIKTCLALVLVAVLTVLISKLF